VTFRPLSEAFIRSRYSRELCDRLGEGNSDWQRAKQFHQVDQGVR